MQKLINQERLKAHAGAALSHACVKFPYLIGRHVIGEPHEDGYTADAYPLTPLRWRVSKAPAASVRNFVEYPGDPDAGRLPKDYPTAAISSIDVGYLRPHVPSPRYVPSIAWAYGDQLMMAEIPESELDGVSDHTFRFAMRRGPEPLKLAAGAYLPTLGQLWVRTPLTMEGIVPVSEIPEDVPAF